VAQAHDILTRGISAAFTVAVAFDVLALLLVVLAVRRDRAALR
jgi:hypothetical protein